MVPSETVTHSITIIYRAPGSRVGDSPGATRVPSLAAHKISASLPVDRVGTVSSVGVCHWRGAIRPPGKEVSVVGTLGAGCGLAPHELEHGLGVLGVGGIDGFGVELELCHGHGKDAGDGGHGPEDCCEGHHSEMCGDGSDELGGGNG